METGSTTAGQAGNAGKAHRWRFFRAGGFDQVRLERGSDLANLERLDQKLWTALSCPTKGLEFDVKTLELVDTDKDGRIRVPEILAAVRWAVSLVKNPDVLVRGSDALELGSINETVAEGKQMLEVARRILAHLGKKDAGSISLADVADTVRFFAETQFNGDGVVPPEATDDAALRRLIQEVVACCGPEADRSGKPGVSQAKVEQFYAAAQAYSDWWKQAERDAGSILPLGPATASASVVCQSVRAKVDDYFARCRLAAFDARALAAVNREEKEYLALAAKDLAISSAEIAAFPIARVEAGRPLPLKEGVNPAWGSAVARLHAEVVRPLLGDKASLTEAEWAAVSSRFAAYDAWAAAKAGGAVEELGLERVREILAGNGKESMTALIARDKALEPEFNAIASLEKLIRFHRDLIVLLNNYVSFRDFYHPEKWAVFQVGTLYLDQRGCELCVRVDDAGKHAALAGMAKAYLAYCDCVRPASGEKMAIAAAFTGGDADRLMVGRNGIFYDRKGRDWDATITKIVENPISVRQAFWAPYKKFVRMIEEQVAKRAAAAEAATTTKLEATASTVAAADKAKAAPPKKFDVGTVAALGVGVGAIGTLLGGFVTGFLKLTWWQMPLAVLGVVFLISLPSVIIAWLKLRQRNLGPILDANGWAVNARAKLNIPFGASLTQVAVLPAGSERSIEDPFAEKPSPWPRIVIGIGLLALALYVLDLAGKLHPWTGGLIGSKPLVTETNALSGGGTDGTNAPAEAAR